MNEQRRREVERFIINNPPCYLDKCEMVNDSDGDRCEYNTFTCSPGTSAMYGLLLAEIDRLKSDREDEINLLKEQVHQQSDRLVQLETELSALRAASKMRSEPGV